MAKQKSRTRKISPNTAGTQRATIQAANAKDNEFYRSSGIMTSWEKAKEKRRASRVKAGKVENWLKRQKYSADKLARVK